jgi:hypothetical protein
MLVVEGLFMPELLGLSHLSMAERENLEYTLLAVIGEVDGRGGR